MRIKIIAAFIFTLSACAASESGNNVRIVNISNNTTNVSDGSSNINSGINLGNNKKLEGSIVKGSGKTGARNLKLPAFSEIKIKNGMAVKVDASAKHPGLKVTGDDNIIPLIKVKVIKGILNVGYGSSFTTNNALNITVFAPTLQTLTATGASRVSIKGLDVKEIKIIGKQGTQITATGKTDLLELLLSNAASFKGTKLKAKNAKIKMDIATTAELNVSNQATGTNNLGTCSFVNKPIKNTIKQTKKFPGFSR